MKSIDLISVTRNWIPRDQWEYQKEDLTKEEERNIIATVVEVALKILFKNFTYKFGGKYFHQSQGGPIGVRATGAAAQLVMEHWGLSYRSLLEAAGIEIFLLSGYVDDGRQISTTVRKGTGFRNGEFKHSEDDEQEDERLKEQDESENQMMARVLKPAMNSINPDLRFTTECQEDFEHERLLTLDFEMWLTETGVKHSYFQKPMKTPLVLMERSGMSYQQKFQILSKERNRRMSNILTAEICQSEINTKIEQYICELKISGYSLHQSRDIVVSGLRGWRNKVRKRKCQNIPFYRLAENTVDERLRKEIFEKENLYKSTNYDGEEESPKKYVKTNSRLRAQHCPRAGRSSRRPHRNDDVSSVLFVPHTVDSGLAKILKEKENKLKEITGNKMKIVEKSGQKLEDIIY